MPSLDSCHFQVVWALQKAGWQTSSAPAFISAEESDRTIYIDIYAQKSANGARGIAQEAYLEVKCFPGKNTTQELYIALGQYLVYRAILDEGLLRVPLYLAIPSTIFEEVFFSAARKILRSAAIKVIIVDIERDGEAD